MIAGVDFLVIAQTLVQGRDEAEWRSAVSRAYYGAFHCARNLLRDLHFQIPRGDQAHAYLWMRLSNCGDAQTQIAGSELNRLRTERNKADYEIWRNFSRNDAMPLVKAAQRVIHIIEGARNEPVRTIITDSIKAYERDVLK